MKKFALISLFLALGVTASFACTNLIVGKKASADGSVFITYSADSYCMFGELVHFPAGKWAKGTMIPIYEWDTGKYLGEIEQAPETYNVIGNINEFQVSIAETTFRPGGSLDTRNDRERPRGQRRSVGGSEDTRRLHLSPCQPITHQATDV